VLEQEPGGDLLRPKVQYPDTRRGDTVDDYHGTNVADPYRWLEDLDSPETVAWIAEQNRLTETYLQRQPIRAWFQERIQQLWNFRKTGLPVIEGGRLFYRRNSGLQLQAPLYMRATLTAPPTLLLDPNLIWPEGTTSLAAFEPSPDTRHLAYAFAAGGADWQTIRIRSLAARQDLADELHWMRFSGISWTNDSLGFFYARYPEPPAGRAMEAALSGHALHYHALGTPQSADRLIYTNAENPTWFVSGTLTDEGRYLLVTTSRGADHNNRLYVADLGDPAQPTLGAPLQPIFEEDDAELSPVGSDGSTLYLRTDRGAPNRRIVAIELGHGHRRNAEETLADVAGHRRHTGETQAAGDRGNTGETQIRGGLRWRTVVPESAHAIESATLAGGRLFVEYLVDVKSRLAMFDLAGCALGEVALPAVGSLSGLVGRGDSILLFYAFTSHLYPTTVFSYDIGAGTSTPFEAEEPPVDVSQYETTQMFAVSRDGARVPFFVTARKGLARDGSNPAMLNAYGGFSISVTPVYRPDVPAWLDLGGIWVTANLRGGAEYGEAWHTAGMLEQKQNVFDDFIAVAEHLITERYTSPVRLGMMGGSNGGLLVAAVMEQRPDLFAVALPAVGVMDMLRYDRFTGGRAWVTEYGSAHTQEQFPALLAYSPLHNLSQGTCYPATLVTTADHDDRVVPSHSFKFAAALQFAQGCDKPTLIRVETGGSHNFRSTDKRIAELADEWTFTAAQMGIDPQSPIQNRNRFLQGPA
jgi:prolyl oligopeptidase